MQKIDKNQILSTNYETWHNGLGNIHPKYDSKHMHYYDVKMSLMSCQKGLCAYTEEMLCDEKYFDISNWQNGQYSTPLNQNEKNEIQGDIEHFDESLKPQKGWLWDNLFIAHVHVNRNIKKSKPIKNILKPDSPTYDPYKYLDFDYETGIFFPNTNLEQSEKDDVSYMIEILGINCLFTQRKKQLQEWKDRIDVGLNVNPYRFITAWNMTLKNL